MLNPITHSNPAFDIKVRKVLMSSIYIYLLKIDCKSYMWKSFMFHRHIGT